MNEDTGITRLFFFLLMIVTMTGFGCGGGGGGGADAGIPINLIADRATVAANSTPLQGSVTQTSNTDANGVTRNSISSTPSYVQESLRATVRNGATILGTSDIVDDWFDFNRALCQSCGTPPSGTSSQWQHVSFEKEESNGTVYSIVFSDMEDNDDLDYLSAGIWIYVPEEAADSMDLDDVVYGTFARGNRPFSQDNLPGLTGEATYEGDAIGLYTDETTTTAGLFNATVALTANFGDASQTGTISGSVTNFSARDVDRGQSISFQGTRLDLGAADIRDTRAGFFTGDTSGSHQGNTYSGKWGGEFLGNGASPTSVTGTFGAEHSDITFMGVFGAYQQ
ncbi:MAG: hypothetical protein OXF47_02615 [Nitrospira sp.]|nr:hypothetical protein [Nitrospira sp.]